MYTMVAGAASQSGASSASGRAANACGERGGRAWTRVARNVGAVHAAVTRGHWPMQSRATQQVAIHSS